MVTNQRFSFIRCPNDDTVKYHTALSVSAQRFSLEAFKFIADHPFVFVQCHATEPTQAPSAQRNVHQVAEEDRK